MKKVIVFICFTLSVFCNAQEKDVESFFDGLTIQNKSLNNKVRMDVSGLTIYEVLNVIALENKINIDVDAKLKTEVESNFFDIPVKNVFSFIANKYKLDVTLISGVISFRQKQKNSILKKKEPLDKIDVSFVKKTNLISLKLKAHSLEEVCEKITDLSGRTILISPKIRIKLITAYIVNSPIEKAMDMIAKSNQIDFKIEDNVYYFDELKKNKPKIKSESINNYQNVKGLKTNAKVKVNNGVISINAYDVDVMSLIDKVAKDLNSSYFMYDKLEGLKTSMLASFKSFDKLLQSVFNGSEYTFDFRDGIYYIGKTNTQNLRITKLIQFQNRTIESSTNLFTKNLLKGVEVKEFKELNGFVVSGPYYKVDQVSKYIRQIDQVVPMVLIEVIIVQYKKSFDVTTGLRAILGNGDKTTKGQVLSSFEMDLSKGSINKLLKAFNGYGIFNLGQISKDFYMNLSALEQNSIIKLKSTPKISALNGIEAKLSIGETNYYFEQNNRLISNNINNDVLQSGSWKSTDANLIVNITPNVSKDEQITMKVVVERSRFLERQTDKAPPGKATQMFESIIRCKNGEMILMGGLDDIEKEDSGKGLPWLSRVPVLKWFFSDKRKRKSKSKLHVFIKPTVVY